MRRRPSRRRSWRLQISHVVNTLLLSSLAAAQYASAHRTSLLDDSDPTALLDDADSPNVTCSSQETLDSVVDFCTGGKSELTRADCAGSFLQYVMLDSDQMPLLSCLAVALVNRTSALTSAQTPTQSLLEHTETLSQKFQSVARAASPSFVSNIASLKDLPRIDSFARPRRPSPQLMDSDTVETFTVTDCYRSVARSVDRLWILNQGDYIAMQSYSKALNLTKSLASNYCTSVCNNACIDAVVTRFVKAISRQCDLTSSANQPVHCDSDAAFAQAMSAICSEPAIMNANSSNADFSFCQMTMGRALMNTKRVPEASSLCGELAKLSSNLVEDTISCLYGIYLEYFHALSTSLTPVEEWAPSACDYLLRNLTQLDTDSQLGPEPVVCAGAMGTSLMYLTGFDVDTSNGHCDTLSSDVELVTTCKTAVADALTKRSEHLASDLESCAADIESEETECFSSNPQVDCEACFDTSTDPRCGNLGIEQCVCEYDAVCCNNQWDMSCVHLVSQFDCPCIAGNVQFIHKPTSTAVQPTTVVNAVSTAAPVPQTTLDDANVTTTSKSKFVAIYITIGSIIICAAATVFYLANRAQRSAASAEPTGPPGSNMYRRSFLHYLCPCFGQQGFQRVDEAGHEGSLDSHDQNLPSDEVMQLQPIGPDDHAAAGAGSANRLIADSDSDGDDIGGFTAEARAKAEKKSALRRARDALSGKKRQGTAHEERALTSDVGGHRSNDDAGDFRRPLPPAMPLDVHASDDDEPINAADARGKDDDIEEPETPTATTPTSGAELESV